MYKVIFRFEQQGQDSITLRDIEAGQSLLEVALNHGIALRHNCGGVCSCSTCHLYVDRGGDHLEEMSRKETTFLARVLRARPHSRLACQCLLLEGRGVVEVTVPGQP